MARSGQLLVIGKLGYSRTTRHDGELNKLIHRTGATVSIRIVVKPRILETIQGKNRLPDYICLDVIQ